jgi:hypothetical protein
MNVRSIAKRVPFANTVFKMFRDSSREAFFEHVYRTGDWGVGRTESRSGPGSGLVQTNVVRTALSTLITELRIASILDIPCGDFHWMRYVDLSGIHYIGADLVGDMIATNESSYGGGSIEFRVLDVTRDRLPTVDLILCRDCLVHFSNRLIAKALEQIKESGSHYLLGTTFPESANRDIATGGWRPIDLTAKPHSLPSPIRLIAEGNLDARHLNKSLALWDIAEL